MFVQVGFDHPRRNQQNWERIALMRLNAMGERGGWGSSSRWCVGRGLTGNFTYIFRRTGQFCLSTICVRGLALRGRFVRWCSR